MYRGIGIEFLGGRCGLYWNEMSDNLAKHGAMKNTSETSYSNLLLSSHEIISVLEKIVYKQNEEKLICDTSFFEVFWQE